MSSTQRVLEDFDETGGGIRPAEHPLDPAARRSPHPLGPLGVGQQVESGSELAGQLEQPVPWFEGNRDHHGISGLNLRVVLAQLRQVLPSGHSSEMALKYQDYGAAPKILKGHEPAVGV